MGASLSAEQQKLVTEHLAKQQALVQGLQSVIEQQARALEAMAEDDDDYDENQEQDHDGDESGDEEFDQLSSLAAAAEKKQVEPEVDAAEAKEADVNPADFNEEAEARGFQAVKPWLGAMAPPTGWQKKPEWDELPNVKLELEYVYGYRARLVRNNARWIDSDRVVYFSAGVGIVHNLANNTQKFFFGHDDDIISLDYHVDRKLVVTGQQGKTPRTCVWDAESCQQLACLEGYHKRAVVACAFSADGNKVATVGLDDNHSVAVYDWQAGAMIAESKGDTSKILTVAFNRTKSADANNDFVTVGVKHIKFWSCAGGALKAQKGLLGRKGKRQPFISLAFNDSCTLVGAKDGNVYPFQANKLKKGLKAHNGMVYSLANCNGMTASGGKDGAVCIWDSTNQQVKQFDMNKQDPTPGKVSARSLNFLPSNPNILLIGCITSALYSANISTGEVKCLTTGHFGDLTARAAYGELWGLSPTPGKATFATAGEDHTLRVWDVSSRKEVTRVELGAPALSCGYSPDGQFVAVGFKDGAFAVYETATWGEELRKKKRKRRIPVVKFSPNSKFLAVGSADNVVDIYDVEQEFRRIGVCKGNSSVILHLDWSADSAWIQTMSQSYELLFYDSSGEHNPRSKSLKDTQWSTQECVLGWNVQGIWPKFSDGSDINIVNLSNSRKYLCTAEDSGLVKVFNFPCIGSGLHPKTGKLSRRPKSQKGMGHSSHVTNANWLFDDSYVITCGGGDLAVMQWKVVAA